MQENSINNYNAHPVYASQQKSDEVKKDTSYATTYQPVEYNHVGYQYARSYVYPQINYTQQVKPSDSIPWITDTVIKDAVNKLAEVQFLPGDLEHMKKLGVNTIYNNGAESLKTLVEKGIKVEFGPVSDPRVHAQWEKDKNLIVINEKYKDTKDPAVILAISEAMFHELGHAKDGDDLSSVQEELDCLALNTLANRYHQYYYPNDFNSSSNAEIINNGVGLYTKLFFDTDPDKQALVNRIAEKYGDLPLTSPNHGASVSALVIKKLTNIN